MSAFLEFLPMSLEEAAKLEPEEPAGYIRAFLNRFPAPPSPQDRGDCFGQRNFTSAEN
jgi:hypothetical protein